MGPNLLLRLYQDGRSQAALRSFEHHTRWIRPARLFVCGTYVITIAWLISAVLLGESAIETTLGFLALGNLVATVTLCVIAYREDPDAVAKRLMMGPQIFLSVIMGGFMIWAGLQAGLLALVPTGIGFVVGGILRIGFWLPASLSRLQAEDIRHFKARAAVELAQAEEHPLDRHDGEPGQAR